VAATTTAAVTTIPVSVETAFGLSFYWYSVAVAVMATVSWVAIMVVVMIAVITMAVANG